MSYTLRGRVDSRLLASLAPALAAGVLALVLHRWWPLELAGLMVGVGVALDVALYDRLLPYQPGWAAIPLGALELGLVMALATATGVRAPLAAAVAFFIGSWLLAQVLGHAVYPLVALSYGDDGGELGRPGASAAAGVVALFLAAGAVAWTTRPPTVTLAAGVHPGPIVLDREQTLVGRPGAVVRGGIVVTADGVTVRDVTVVGAAVGIEVSEARRVRLERVTVVGATLDGIQARRSEVAIRHCAVTAAGAVAQGIDVSFAMEEPMSSVRGCDVAGGAEGIVTHMAMVDVGGNRVHGTTLRGITMTEMSMGHVTGNTVSAGRGVGIFCGDSSDCAIERNVVSGTTTDGSGDPSRAGVGIEAYYNALARLEDNVLSGNGLDVGEFAGGEIERG